jgi:hypothetical protein
VRGSDRICEMSVKEEAVHVSREYEQVVGRSSKGYETRLDVT